MLIRTGDVIGTKVYTLSDGKRIDDISDVIYDAHGNKVVALLTSSGSLLSDAKIIFLQDIKGMGRDAVLVDTEDSLKDSSHIPEHIAHIARGDKRLTKLRVITEKGTDLGSISDILFDPKTGAVEEFEVTQGLRSLQSGKKTIKFSDIITVGEDAVIVSGFTEEKFEQQARERGFQGAVTQTTERIKERAPSVWEQVKSESQELAGRAREEWEEFTESPRTKEVIEDVKQTAKEAQRRIERAAKPRPKIYAQSTTRPRRKSVPRKTSRS